MKIALSCDHGGWELKDELRAYFDESGKDYIDFGLYAKEEEIDYPYAALKACNAVLSGECDRAIIVCGTGIGVSMAANKIHGIRAACCENCYSARYTRLHNDANVLCLGNRVLGGGLAIDMIELFLNTEFEGGRHGRRVDLIMDIQDGKIK